MLMSGTRHLLRQMTAYVLVTIIGVSGTLSAQTHVVSPGDLQKEIASSSKARQRNLETINSLLSSPKVEDVLSKAGVDPARLKSAVAALNDEELAQLAARSEKAQADFAAGRLADRDLLIILIGLAALILIIVAVR